MRLFVTFLFVVLLSQPASAGAPTPHPAAQAGRAGLVEPVAQIMARARAADARAAAEGRRPRLKAEREVERDELPQDPDALAIPSYGAIEAAHGDGPHVLSKGTRAPQAVATSFLGATLADTGAFPPDTMGAVGPTQFVVAVNGRIRTFSKATGALDGALDADMGAFFDSVMTPPTSSNFTSDPHIRYDRLSGRWFVLAIDVPGMSLATPNRMMLAVSSGPTIGSASSFTFFHFQHDLVAPMGLDTGKFADYPTLGIDANALYIGDNVFNTNGSFAGCSGFVVQKSSVLGAGPMVVHAFRGLVPNATSDGPYTPQGVDNYDPAATEGYFIGVSNNAFGRLILRRVINAGSASPTISSNIAVTVPTTNYPTTVPHLGNTNATSGYLDALDDRLFAAHLRNGRLWTAHNIQVDANGVAAGMGHRDGARWYELQNVAPGQTPSLRQSGTLFDAAASYPASYFIPTVMVSGQGHAAFAFSHSGAANRINAGTAGRLANDPLGTLQAPSLYTASSTAYNPPADPGANGSRRWGDYSYTSLDPTDDMTMWTIAEYNEATNSYGVRIAKLLAPPPAMPASASRSIAAGQSDVDVTITGASLDGSGFYDPGASPAGNAFNHIAASVGGAGVTVNRVTYTSPTSITLNISAALTAATGARSVTVTNPDGQSTTGAAILTVTAAVNLPPSLDAGKTPLLSVEYEDAPSPAGAVGTPVSSLVDLDTPAGGLDNVTDPNAGAVTGMAVFSAASPNGTWYYTLDGGAVWSAFPAVSASSALLLPASAGARVYFRPYANFNGVVSFGLLAWDRSSGVAGSTVNTAGSGSGTSAFSASGVAAQLVVMPVNDAPTLDPIASPLVLPLNAAPQSVGLAGIGNIDAGQALSVSASSDNPALIANPTVAYSSPDAAGSLGFTPAPGLAGAATIRVTVSDDGGTANGGVDRIARAFVVTVGDAVFADGFE